MVCYDRERGQVGVIAAHVKLDPAAVFSRGEKRFFDLDDAILLIREGTANVPAL